MVYAFMEDRALTYRGTTSRVALTNDPITEVGYFDDKMANSFLNPGAILDIRALRIPILGVSPYTPAIPGMQLHFDVDNVTNDSAIAIDFNEATSAELDMVFNICDLVFLSQGLTLSALEVLLNAGAPYKDIYQSGTLALSTDLVTATDVMLNTGLLGSTIQVHTWVQFTVTLTTLGSVTFKVWIGKDAFEDEYPISTITKILFPCSPAKLLSPSDLSIVHAVSFASQYVAQMLPDEVANHDHTGTVASIQAYYNATHLGLSSVSMTFEVFYKGKEPTSSECRTAIVLAIQDLIDLGTGDLASWQVIFPALYVELEWYLIPLWSNTTTEPPEGLVIFSGISSYSAYQSKLTELFGLTRSADIPSKIELLKAASCELYIAAFPAAANAVSSLKDVSIGYAQYQTDPGPGNELSDDLVLFKAALESTLAYIQGTTLVHTSTTDNIDGHDYESFTVGSITFHVLVNEEV
jgi:hypothetical protein